MAELPIETKVAIISAVATIVAAVVASWSTIRSGRIAKAASDKAVEIAHAARGDAVALRLWERRLDACLEIMRLGRNAAGMVMGHHIACEAHAARRAGIEYKALAKLNRFPIPEEPPDGQVARDATLEFNHYYSNAALLVPRPIFLAAQPLCASMFRRMRDCDEGRVEYEAADAELSRGLANLLQVSYEALVLEPAGEKMSEALRALPIAAELPTRDDAA